MSVASDTLAFDPPAPVRHVGPADAAGAARGIGRTAGETLWCRFDFETGAAFADRVFAAAAAGGFEMVEFVAPWSGDS